MASLLTVLFLACTTFAATASRATVYEDAPGKGGSDAAQGSHPFPLDPDPALYPKRILMVRRGCGLSKRELLKETFLDAEIYSEEESRGVSGDYAEDIATYEALMESFKPDLIFGASSGATVIAALADPARGEKAWKGPVLMIGAVKANLLTKNPDLPIVFFHSLRDAYGYVKGQVQTMTRALLFSFPSGHVPNSQDPILVNQIKGLCAVAMSLKNAPLRQAQKCPCDFKCQIKKCPCCE